MIQGKLSKSRASTKQAQHKSTDDAISEGSYQSTDPLTLGKIKRSSVKPVSRVSLFLSSDNLCFFPGDLPILMVGSMPRIDPSLHNYKFGIKDAGFNQKEGLFYMSLFRRQQQEQTVGQMYEKVKYYLNKAHQRAIDYNKIIGIFERYMAFTEDLKNNADDLKKSKVYQYFKLKSKECEKRRLNTLAKYPCGVQKMRYVDGEFQMVELGTNAGLNQLFGWDKDTFMNILFQKGIPEYTSIDDPFNSKFLDGPSNYLFNLESKNPYRCPPFPVNCYLKAGFAVKAFVKSLVFERCEGDEIGYDLLIPIVGAESDAKMLPPVNKEENLNSQYLEDLQKREQDWSYLLSDYKQFKPTLPLSTEMKTCRIKELNTDEQSAE